ncbi:MAG: SET domain-containing protein [Candidatus Parcubacteria bacterium]|nr:SET domain-containing protein [Candidatus Parcubacteria bacterium]
MLRTEMPHEGVFTRLGSSKIHGVGVFAIKDIKEGTYIFLKNNEEMTWVEEKKIEKLPKETYKLYKDFCVFKGGMVGCPKNFNLLTVEWYLNNSKTPNCGCDKNYNFFALRDIKRGEELTIDYKNYSDK